MDFHPALLGTFTVVILIMLLLDLGVFNKKEWLKKRITEGHVFRKLNVQGKVFVEYAPLEKAWVPIEGTGFLYIYCLWVSGKFKGQSYGKQLLEYVINDAKKKGT